MFLWKQNIKSYKNFTLRAKADNTKQIKAIWLYKSSITWMNHFKWYFKRAWVKYEHMTKFKWNFPMRQLLKMKPIKWGLKWRFQCTSFTGYLCEFSLCLGWKKDVEVNLGKRWLMQLPEKELLHFVFWQFF